MLPQHSKVLNNYRLLVFFIDWFLRFFFFEIIEYDEVREVGSLKWGANKKDPIFRKGSVCTSQKIRLNPSPPLQA